MKDEIMKIKPLVVKESSLKRLPLSYRHVKFNLLVSQEIEQRYVIRNPRTEHYKVYTPYDRVISKVLDYSTLQISE